MSEQPDTGATPAGAAADPVPDLPGYTIQGELGRGALGVVFRAARNGQEYAVKLYRGGGAAESLDASVRFRREAAALARLNHPSLVKVFEVGEHRGRPYLVMQLVRGQNVAEALERGPLPHDELARVARNLAGALAEIHRRGLVHRDLKPSNVILDSSGTARIVDFGFVAEAAQSAAPEEGLAGTLLYAAPEQTGILKRALDGRADLYALGALLFECATGRPPFRADSAAELLRLHAAVAPPLANEVNAQVSPVLSAMLAKLLAKDPDDRYQTAEGLLADLDGLAALEAAHAGGRPYELGAREPREGGVRLPLVGRAAELARLSSALAAARQGRGGAVLVEGEGGSGKTRLARELLRKAQDDGLTVLEGKCQQAERTPFGPVREAVDAYIGRILTAPVAERAARLEQIRSAAGDFAPLLQRLSRGLEIALVSDSARAQAEPTDHERFFDAVAELLAQLSQECGGLVLFLDDVQWIDAASLQVLSRLDRRLGSAPLLVACAARPGREAGRVAERLGHALSVRMALPPLSSASMRELISAHLGGGELDASMVDWIATRANGNAFAAGEYVRALLEGGLLQPSAKGWAFDRSGADKLVLPTDVLELVVSRLSTLSDDAARVLRAAAIGGTTFAATLVARTLSADVAAVARALAEAGRAGLVERLGGDSYGFVHDRVREALAGTLSVDERRRLHQAAAEALDLRAATSPDDVFALARHYAGGIPDKAPARRYEATLQAGLLAVELYANEEAIEYLGQALAAAAALPEGPPRRGELHQAMGQACARTDRTEEAISHFRKALEHTREPLARSRIRAQQCRVHIARLETKMAWREYRRSLAELGHWVPRSLLGWALWAVGPFLLTLLLGAIRWGYGKATGAELERRVALAELYLQGGWVAYLTMQHPVTISGFVARLLLNGHFIGPRRAAVEPMATYAAALATSGLGRAATEQALRSLRLAEQLGDRGLLALANARLGETVHMAGEVRRAEEVSRKTLQEHGRWLSSWEYYNAYTDLAVNLLTRGYAREALEVHQSGLERPGEHTHSERLTVLASLATSHALLGDFAAAAKALEACRELIAGLYDARLPRFWMLGQVMLSCLEQGELGAAAEQAIAETEGLRLAAGSLPFHYKLVLVARAWLRVRQHVARAPIPPGALRRALRELRRVTTTPTIRCQLEAMKAVLAREAKRPRAARALLRKAKLLARAGDSPWGAYEVALEEARAAREAGDGVAAERHAREALELAARHGWKARARSVGAEFGVAPQPQAGERAATPELAQAPAAGIGTRRYLDALLQVSLASASALQPIEQARAALDELLRLLGAERGFFFQADPDSGELRFLVGRDGERRDVAEATRYSSTVVAQVRESRSPLVVAGTDQGALLGSESAVAHELRSIIAAPLLVRDRLAGVVYLDSRLAKGLFTAEDVDFLLAISNHIAVAVETARTARLELERRELDQDLALAGAVQALYLPRERDHRLGGLAARGFYRPAAKCGGDWWWFEPASRDVAWVLVGDVTGHGAASAMVTASAATGFQLSRRLAPARALPETLTALHDVLRELCRGEYLMTMSALEIDAARGEVRSFNAGGMPAFALLPDGRLQSLAKSGNPLGSAELVLGRETRQLEPGERLLVFTDGLPELKTPKRPLLGAKRLSQLFASTAGLPLPEASDALVRALDDERQGLPQGDDVTFVMLEWSGLRP